MTNKNHAFKNIKNIDTDLRRSNVKTPAWDNGKSYQTQMKKKRFLKLLLLDVVIAAVGLIVFAFFHHGIARADYSTPEVLVQATAAVIQDESPTIIKSTQEAPQATQEPVYTEPMLNYAFADKFTEGEVIATDTSYQSKNINFTIDTVTEGDITYHVADIYIRDISNFRTAFAQDQYGQSISDSIQNIASSNNALLSLTGDYYSVRSDGIVIRNGELYRDAPWEDVLIMNYDGSMQTFSEEEFDMDSVIANGAYQGWSFGPMLLKDGQPMSTFTSGARSKNPRSSIGYYEPGHYVFIAVDGRGQSGSTGMTLAELSNLYYELGCKVAYNLDGGGSAKMMFMDSMVNNPSSRSRPISDILMIVETDGN